MSTPLIALVNALSHVGGELAAPSADAATALHCADTLRPFAAAYPLLRPLLDALAGDGGVARARSILDELASGEPR